MKKLLKFAAPILILALLFASCDDRGSTPSGGSDLTVTIGLPARSDYPSSSSSWQAYLIPADSDISGSSLAEVFSGATKASVKYTAASGDSSASVLVTGIPAGSYQNGVMLTYEGVNSFTGEPTGSTYMGSAAISGQSMGQTDLKATLAGQPGQEFQDITLQTISIALTGIAPTQGSPAVIPLPSDAASYTVTLQPQSGKAIAIPTSAISVKPGKAGKPYDGSSGEAPTATLSIATSYEYATLASVSYTANITYGTGADGTYTASVSAVSVQLGKAAPSDLAGTFAKVAFGSIKVSLPGTISSKAPGFPTPSVAYNAATLSYSFEVLDSHGNVIVPETTPVAGTALGAQYASAYEIPGVPSASSATYTVNASVAYSSDDTAISLEGTAQSTSGTAAFSAFEAQVSSVEVTLKNGPESYPASAASYLISYAECNASGKPVSGGQSGKLSGDALSAAVASITASNAGKFAISGLKNGAMYSVTVEIGGTANYSGTAVTPELVSVDSTVPPAATANAATLYLNSLSIEVTGGAASVENVSSAGSITLAVTSTEATGVEGIAGSITLTAKGSSTCDVSVSGVLYVPESSQSSLSGLQKIEWTSPSGGTGGFASTGKITLSGSYSNGAFSVNAVTVTAAD